ncbi:MAG: RNA 2',3'-cyclic phosphodiesterase, partial [Candidatus Pacebacteria bacterium]|nr:RNA 2',3'-cyclic phosphodiesterase [Candidatus Paceibacterota bacterium]
MDKTRRLFIAINLPMELKRKLFGMQKEINSQFGEDYIKAGLFKWVEMENLHLTLKFIGEVGDSQIPKITENIVNTIKNQKEFEIKTKQICYDSEKQAPRLIWLVTERSKNLENLAKEFDVGKKFIGHITLARVKEWIFKRIEPEERPNIMKSFEEIIPVKAIELMESVLKRTGPEYKII